MPRLHQLVLIFSTLLGSWLAMQAVHECGHLLGARLTGGRLERVVLHPFTISRTDLAANPQPLMVAWAGPVVGSALPLVGWIIVAGAGLPGGFVVRFFAGFCLLANGLYLAAGSFSGVGDCGDLLRHGAAIWQLWLFGVATIPVGLVLWHRQGVHFGLGPDARPVNRGVAYVTLLVCLGFLALGFAVGGK